MADNVFDLLNDEEREEREERVEENEEKKEVNQQMNIPSPEENVPLITTIDQNGDNNWTDVSSTKTRKTAIPVASLFKQQPKQDDTTKTNTAPVPAPAPSTAAQAADSASKKKVVRFTREEILALYRPTKCLPEIAEISDIVSLEALEPECRAPFDHEEILRIWSSGDGSKQKDAAGRGRGRGRKDDEGYSGQKEEESTDIWDDVDSANSKTFDLADFSAAAFKFSESATKFTEAASLYSKEGDETMESLIKEETEKKHHEESKGNERGRNLLLQTLAVKTPTETKAVVPFSPFKATIQASTDDTLLDELIEEDVGGISSAAVVVDDSDKFELDDSLTFDAADDLDIDDIIGGLTAVPLTTPTTASKPQLQVIPPAPAAPAPVPAVPVTFLQQQQSVQQQTHQVQLPQNPALYSLGSQQMPRPQMVSPSRPPPQPQHVPIIPQPPPVLMPDKWIYRDPHGNIQGPFEMTAMRRWLESGYFKENLPIKMTRWSTFHPLGIVYPNPETAFLGLVHEPLMQSPQVMQAPQVMHPPQHMMHQAQQAAPQQSVPQPQVASGDQRQREVVKQEPQKVVEPDDEMMTGKRAVAKSTLILTAPDQDADSASKSTKKQKDPQPVQNPEPKVKQPAKATDTQAVPLDSNQKQKDAKDAKDANSNNNNNNNNKKTKSTKKSPKDEELSAGSKNDNTASTATPWASKKGRDANESKALKLTEIQQQEEAAKKHSASDNQQIDNPPASARSFQLKNLLGVGGKEKGWSSNSAAQGTSLRDIQMEQEKLIQETISQRAASGPPAAPQQPLPSQSQWKAPVGQGQAKPFAKIIEEEKLAASTSQAEVKVAKGSWAAKAGGSKALESGIPAAWIAGQSQRVESENTDPTPAAAAAVGKGKRTVVSTTDSSTPSTSNVVKPTSTTQPAAKKSGTSASTSSTVAVVPSAPSNSDSIVDWSVQQLKRLSSDNKNTTDDLALIEFCLTLKSAVEIREYLADYLGSTPQVSQFATEFIRRKEGKQPTQLRSTAGGTALSSSSLLEKEKKAASTLPTETTNKKKKQKGKSSES